ncbi:condensation domain-containing protein [Actinokineospora sp.]|uniref:condensation domain-containing protein n=1 Tax=Actinokineospora sp. TaxID=1872133 RepID=UPI003D6B9185
MHVDALLSHGQLYSWREVDTYPRDWKKEANLPATWDLRGRTLEQVRTALRRLFDRHEPLRTTYHLRDGEPVQRVHADLPMPVDRVDRVITDYGDPDRTTAALVDVAFPMTDSLCWRAVLVTTGGEPMFLSLSFSHLIVDVWSIIELEAQFKALIETPDAPEPVCLSPRELAGRQREESWQGRQNSAERYWRRVLADDLTHQFPTLPLEKTEHRVQATLHSNRLGGLAAQAAKQHGVSAPAVLLGLVAAGLAEHTGAERVAMSVMSSNRFAAEYQHVVGTLNQLIPVVTTVDHRSTLAEHLTALHWASAKAYRSSLYDLDRIAAMAEEANAAGEHDCWFNHLFQCWFNYLQLDGRPCDAADETPAELVWTPVARQYGQPFDVRVTVKGGRTSVALRADPDVVSAQGITDILRAVALGAERAATDPDSTLKDLWSARAEPLAPTLFPPVTPAPPK